MNSEDIAALYSRIAELTRIVEDNKRAAEASRYNGWKNYPTWCVNQWLSDDEGLYRYVTEMVSEIASQTESTSDFWTLSESHKYGTADAIKEFVTSTDEYGGILPDLGATFAADLLDFALDCVDWNRIAEAWLETAAETATS